jgi:hypothetical protein
MRIRIQDQCGSGSRVNADLDPGSMQIRIQGQCGSGSRFNADLDPGSKWIRIQGAGSIRFVRIQTSNRLCCHTSDLTFLHLLICLSRFYDIFRKYKSCFKKLGIRYICFSFFVNFIAAGYRSGSRRRAKSMLIRIRNTFYFCIYV